MKRLFALLTVCILLSGVIALPASAESTATKVDILCTVDPDGDCQVNMTVMLRLEGSYPDLTFPLPPNAKDIKMNGASVGINKTESATQVDISRIARGYTGDLTMSFVYTLPEVVKFNPEIKQAEDKRDLQMIIPLLNGFEFPVEVLSFVINMPAGAIPYQPDFGSTYRQTSFASDLEVIRSGSQIIGSSKAPLNDHEGAWMTMMVPREMFPSVSTFIREGNPEIVPMLICAGLAILYWLLFLRTLPLIPTRTSTPPEGITAGELGCRLTLAGGDLTTMVFSWAQLGYILIYQDGSGRVLLHKRMDMGNERNPFENKVYKLLFGNRRVVDATGYAYAKLCRKVAGMVPNERNMHKTRSGSKALYKVLCCGSQVFCGICVAMNMTAIPVLQILLSIILGVFGAITGWLILGMAARTHLRGKTPVWIGDACIAIWVLLGFLCGQVLIPLICSLGMALMGFPVAYGGRRSDLGRQDAAQVLGLRRYLKRLSKEEIARLQSNDPDYFFHMAPYALALGIINPFAKNFNNSKKIQQCPYIITRVAGKRTPEEWGFLMASIADKMDAKQRRMQIEKWLAVQVRLGPGPGRKPAPNKRPRQKRR